MCLEADIRAFGKSLFHAEHVYTTCIARAESGLACLLHTTGRRRHGIALADQAPGFSQACFLVMRIPADTVLRVIILIMCSARGSIPLLLVLLCMSYVRAYSQGCKPKLL
jgi:hypothetical protein